MRRGWVVGSAAFVVFIALVYFAFSDRTPSELRSAAGREEIFLKRRPSARPGLLTVKDSHGPPSPLPPPSKFPVPERQTIASDFPPDSLCRLIHPVRVGESEAVYNDRLFDELESGSRDVDLDLFRAMREGRWEEVASADRTFPNSYSAQEISWLARADLFTSLQGGMLSGGGTSSMDRDTFDQLDALKKMDPENSFWPLAEFALRKREGVEFDEDALLAEANTRKTYRNPVSDFYRNIRRNSLKDDRKAIAMAVLYASAPILGPSVVQSLREEAGKNLSRDEVLFDLGQKMEVSQGIPKGLDGIEGSVMDAMMGRSLSRHVQNGGRATVPSADILEENQKFMGAFIGTELDVVVGSAVGGACDSEALSTYYSRMREKFKKLPAPVRN